MTNSLGQNVFCGVDSIGATKGMSYCEYAPPIPPILGLAMIGIIIALMIIAYIYDEMEKRI